MSTRILLVDDHEIVRRGLRFLLQTREDFEICGEAVDGRAAVELTRSSKPDVVVMDVTMPLLNGIEAARQIRRAVPKAAIIILSMHESEDVISDVINAGVHGYVSKSDAGRDLIAGIDAVRDGRTFFTGRIAAAAKRLLEARNGAPRAARGGAGTITPREREVLQLLAEGHSNKSVAHALGISVKTAETHRARVMRKLQFDSVADLVRYALRNRIVTDP